LDEAFNFYYHDNFDLLRINGAELVFFSPIHDSVLPDVDGVYIGGGYPELFGTELESNTSMKESILAASKRGMPIYGECGGLMYLTEKIITADMSKSAHITAPMENAEFSMTGVLPGKTLMGTKRVVSYNVGHCSVDCVIGDKGSSFRGHEFHHSEIIDLPADAKYVIELTRGVGIVDGWDGLSVNNVVGCYAHLHGASYRKFAPCFVETCRRYKYRSR
ncbi:MAG: Ni-sirohydrochlorin a,c-diamide synthase, partial [Methanosarcinales archaeon]|nr:Ni-sirohydrochlorin a,c-diamide synthase [Methanosarcinales archaeon]